jgi:hypothetical protein
VTLECDFPDIRAGLSAGAAAHDQEMRQQQHRFDQHNGLSGACDMCRVTMSGVGRNTGMLSCLAAAAQQRRRGKEREIRPNDKKVIKTIESLFILCVLQMHRGHSIILGSLTHSKSTTT